MVSYNNKKTKLKIFSLSSIIFLLPSLIFHNSQTTISLHSITIDLSCISINKILIKQYQMSIKLYKKAKITSRNTSTSVELFLPFSETFPKASKIYPLQSVSMINMQNHISKEPNVYKSKEDPIKLLLIYKNI
jgi:hypothetical protein